METPPIRPSVGGGGGGGSSVGNLEMNSKCFVSDLFLRCIMAKPALSPSKSLWVHAVLTRKWSDSVHVRPEIYTCFF